MKTVNKLIIIIFSFLIISCNNKTNTISQVDLDADKLIYNLEILDAYSDSLYKTDNHNKCEIMLSKNIYVLDKCFEGGIKKIKEVIKYCENHKQEIISQFDVKITTTISIKTNKNEFKEIWKWSDDIGLLFDYEVGNEKINTYAIREGKIKLSTGWVKEKYEIRTCLKIIFEEPDFEGGYKQNILNFARTGNTWELLKRERINTMSNDINKEKIGYCYDTLFHNCKRKFKNTEKIVITNEMLFDLQAPKCY